MDNNSEVKIKNLEEENELLLLQLHQVQEELERYFLELKSIKSGNFSDVDSFSYPQYRDSTPRGPYGAGGRIQGQLSYRLGRVLISQTRSFKGWISLPWALRKVIRDFRVEKSSGSNEKLPPIESYADAYDADRVRQHLSFRLGSVLIQRSRSPIGWMILPWALLKTIKDFRNGVSWHESRPSKKWRMGYLIPGIRKLELQIFEKQTRIEQVGLIQKKLDHKLGLQVKLAGERQSALEAAVKAKDEQTKLAGERQSALEAAEKAKEEQTKLASERQSALEAAVKAKDEQTKLAGERQSALEAAVKAKDEQTKLAGERQSALEAAVKERDALKKTAGDRAARIAELEAQVADQAERQKQIDEQMIRAETQLEMLKEFMRP
jgi:hypothetical protein